MDPASGKSMGGCRTDRGLQTKQENDRRGDRGQ